MVDFDALLAALEQELDDLKEKFLRHFLPARPEDGPEDFEYEVKSFSLLSHAAFEEYVEAVSEALMLKVESDLLAKKTTLSTACFLTAYGLKLELPDDDDAEDQSCFEHIRTAISKAKALHSTALKDNHGFSAKYMRRLLIPVGINMPRGPEMESVKKLAEARGSFAHTMAKLAHYGAYKRAKRLLTPEEVAVAADDCRAICVTLRDRAKAIW
ncbi:hypothetical protein WG907_11895 [Sphingobium sp. AN558]|uniref:hypothetical protein n=1 Tax=Sphingobium sp. AN558 TaxID=3133442 RepID=UPI0030C647C9